MEKILDTLIYTLIIFGSIFGTIMIYGTIFRWCFTSLVRNSKLIMKIEQYLSLISVPIHELSHLIIMYIFCFKINEVKLFNFDYLKGLSNKRGFVNSSFNTKSKIQRIGLLLSSIAPILVLNSLIVILFVFLLPNNFSIIKNFLFDNAMNDYNILALIQSLNWKEIFSINGFIFTISSFTFLSASILSPADIKASREGLFYSFIALFIIIFLALKTNKYKNFGFFIYSIIRYVILFFSPGILILCGILILIFLLNIKKRVF